MIDTKTIATDRIPLNEKLFSTHQINIMLQFNEKEIRAGFVIWFRKSNKIGFINARDLNHLKVYGIKSATIEDCILLANSEGSSHIETLVPSCK